MEPKQIITLLIVCLVSVGLTKYLIPEKVVYQKEFSQEYIDSLTVSKRAMYMQSKSIIDSLEGVTEGFKNELSKKNQEIVNYSIITGSLNQQIDRVKSDSLKLQSLVTMLKDSLYSKTSDTLLISEAIFGDSLFQAVSILKINENQLTLEAPSINQLRPVRIDVGVTVVGDNEAVSTIVTSSDLTNLRVENYTALKQNKKKPWPIIALATGFVIGVLIE